MITSYDDERLEKRILTNSEVNLFCVPVVDQNTIMDKIQFKDSISQEWFYICNANFENGKMFENIKKKDKMRLLGCTLTVSPIEFFHYYRIKWLIMGFCKFNDWKPIEGNIEENSTNCLVLEYLEISLYNLNDEKFLSFIINNCKTLETLKIKDLPYEIYRRQAGIGGGPGGNKHASRFILHIVISISDKINDKGVHDFLKWMTKLNQIFRVVKQAL